ncbi:FHA domain containing protein [Rhodotorula toruloides]|uniref:BY PROTMAP: gi/472582883/gb/EMS20545.1/ FHA domain containing protein [Rhodosporidium toruloides NP11] gi/647396788/emb/CDR39329.1/ RHTO0S04e03994g1_1 [Rhodosporidium toruloides] n=1 Tax=Rhodotorula toruloides TaxID=5286 RepID=A0A0K3CJZ5_RHOTO|nr:FHA domain containing protein [Rhodotorula toruloides]PRQ72568.1 hypothetical protein AAT19DRAFT_16492 [Rhodotorula toruloides]
MGVDAQQGDSYLVLVDDAGAVVKQFARSQGRITLGRASKNDPGTKDPSQGKFRSDNTKVMSSRHAQISWDGDYAHITDLGSTNGVVITRADQKVSLKPNVAYRIFEHDQITFGKQVSERSTGEIICRPLTLTASLRSSASIPLKSMAPGSTAPSVPLVRGRTLTGERYSKEFADYSSDEEDVGPTQAVEDKVADSLKSTSFFPIKRGFGLCDDDVLISPDDEDSSLERLQSVNLSDVEVVNNDSTSRALKPAPSVVESIAAASHVAVFGSPAPDASDVEMIDASSRPASRADSRDARSPRPASPRLVQDEDGDYMEAIKRSMQSFDRPPSPVSPETLKTSSSRLQQDEEALLAEAYESLNERRNERLQRMAELEAKLDCLREPAPSVSLPDVDGDALPDQTAFAKVDLDAPFDAASVASHLPSPVISEAGDSDQEQDAFRHSFSPELDETVSVSIDVEEVEAVPSGEEVAAMVEQAEKEEFGKTRQMQSQLEWVDSDDEILEPRPRQASPVALVDGRPLWCPDEEQEVEPPKPADEPGTPAELDFVAPASDHYADPPPYEQLADQEIDVEEPEPAVVEPVALENDFGLAREVLVDLMAFKAASEGLESESESDDQHESEDEDESSSEVSAIDYEDEEEDEMDGEEEVDEEEEESDGMSEWSGLHEIDEEEELDMEFDPVLSGCVAMELEEARKKKEVLIEIEEDVEVEEEVEEDKTPAPLAREASLDLVDGVPVGCDYPVLDFTGDDEVVTVVQDSETQAAAAVVGAAQALEIDEELPPLQSSPFVEDLGVVGADVGAVVTEEERSDEEDFSSQIEKVSESAFASSQLEHGTGTGSPLPSSSRKRRFEETGLQDCDEDELVTILGDVRDYNTQLQNLTTQALTALGVETQPPASAQVPVVVAAVNSAPQVPQPKRRRLNIPFKSFALGLVTGVIGTVAGLAALPTSDC